MKTRDRVATTIFWAVASFIGIGAGWALYSGSMSVQLQIFGALIMLVLSACAIHGLVKVWFAKKE